jgi:hypothetical protein
MARSSLADLITRLRVLVGDPSGTPTVYSAWQTVHAYVLGDARRPTVANGHWYRVIVAGTSAVGEPTFPTNGGSVIDGTAVWEDQGIIPSGSETFSDDQLQESLDERRTDVVEAQLRTRPSFGDPGLIVFKEYFAPRRWWEDTVVLRNGQGTVLTPDVADLIAGHWSFTTGKAAPVYITGSFFDLYGSASTVLDMWAALTSREFDFSTDQQDFSRSQKREGLLATAREYARRAIQPGARPGWRSLDW